ncbi:hypothetical protein EV360DRAFT_69501 [Lentinula raphanica]|nr:hypothetical protein EV360DRAFT_69501 [Lentinula raphanica]
MTCSFTVLSFLQNRQNQKIIALLSSGDTYDSDIASGLLSEVQKKVTNIPDWSAFYRRATRVSTTDRDIRTCLEQLRAFMKHAREREAHDIGVSQRASHRAKQKLVKELGIRSNPYSVQDVLDGKPGVPVFEILWREQRTAEGRDIKRYHYMSENRHASHSISKLVYLDDYDMKDLKGNVAYIVLSGTPQAYVVEGIVMRGIGMNSSYTPTLTRYLREAVELAVRHRRNV